MNPISSEIIYSEDVGVPEDQLRGWVKPREQLGAFAPVEPKDAGPNTLPGEFKLLLRGRGQGKAGGA